MKIPETQANVGAYYGNEENGPWQPNGVIIDSGVGGGVVGSGDAGVHRPPVYPVHIPRGHIPNYVMAGAYYPPAYPAGPAPQDDFEDYMWMENEEEFDKQVMQQLEEEALMEQCIEAMLEDEQRERHRPPVNGHDPHYPTTSNGAASLEETVSRSTLNPLAAEFVPGGARQCSTTEVKVDSTETKTQETEEKDVTQTQSETVASPEVIEDSKTEDSVPAPVDPPEVSAADIQPIDKDKKTTKKDVKKKEEKKPAKAEVKPKAKPAVVKSEPSVPKKKEVKVVKSEMRVQESEATSVEVQPTSPQQTEEPPTATTEFKPINYAAAAKANKPKKPTTPPATDKTTPAPKIEKVEKKPQLKEKVTQQRKNSTK